MENLLQKLLGITKENSDHIRLTEQELCYVIEIVECITIIHFSEKIENKMEIKREIEQSQSRLEELALDMGLNSLIDKYELM